MRAVILAAGRGSRLHPYTENCPKCLTELAGRTLIGAQIDTLRGAGVEDIIIVTGYLSEMLALPGTRQLKNARWAETNMVGSLFCAEDLFDDDLIVTYGDIVYEPRIIKALLGSPYQTSVIVDRQWRSLWELRFEDPLQDVETLRLSPSGKILEIGQIASSYDEIDAQYIGLMRFRGDGVEALKRSYAHIGDIPRPWMKKRSLENAYVTDLLMEMILTGKDVRAVPISGGWLEVDTVHDYKTYTDLAKRGLLHAYCTLTSP